MTRAHAHQAFSPLPTTLPSSNTPPRTTHPSDRSQQQKPIRPLLTAGDELLLLLDLREPLRESTLHVLVVHAVGLFCVLVPSARGRVVVQSALAHYSGRKANTARENGREKRVNSSVVAG